MPLEQYFGFFLFFCHWINLRLLVFHVLFSHMLLKAIDYEATVYVEVVYDNLS